MFFCLLWLQRDFAGVMAGLQRSIQHPCMCLIICVSMTLLLVLFSQAFISRRQEERYKRDILDSTEIPAEHIDPAAIDLTPLVNTLINSSQSGSRQLFSLLSVTSYSSLALHKLTLLVYNISSIRGIETNMFRRRFCYCVTNETNDLTDFTAILLDVMGNSTSYLHELFKSSSILSVSQRNNSDCIYICVMAGKMGRELPELWEVDSITPLFNQTIVEGPHTGNVSSISLPLEWHQLPTNLSHISPSGMSSMLTSRVHSTAPVSPTAMDEASATTATVGAAQPLAAAQQTTTVMPQSQTTAERPRTTQRLTTQRLTTQRLTTQRATTQRLTTQRLTTQRLTTQRATTQRLTTQQLTTQRMTTQRATTQRLTTQQITTQRATTPIMTQATEKPTTILPPIATSTQPTTTLQVTTVSVSTAAAPATVGTTKPITFSPAISLTRLTAATHQPRTETHHTTSTVHPTRPSPVGPTAGPTMAETITRPVSRRTTTPSKSVETEKAGCPWRRQELTDDSVSGSTTTVGAHKLQPCVLELCKFFSQCLCRPFSHKTRMKRYCDDSHLWYEKHTSEVCRRVRRISFSRNLKQRCLTRMCDKL
ncbi:uncharacterized protein LOC122993489 isoform X3 [Thunnus albacares]|uniref:uncharacterized protein LOC122993489 isoform X3 n=1 Tax=Thunnus albacares TaxID=8236 RepID=UPI001CF6633B|nr:uncharacterized protein LOC122993489 isoform X3 [Thunnus albacares]